MRRVLRGIASPDVAGYPLPFHMATVWNRLFCTDVGQAEPARRVAGDLAGRDRRDGVDLPAGGHRGGQDPRPGTARGRPRAPRPRCATRPSARSKFVRKASRTDGDVVTP